MYFLDFCIAAYFSGVNFLTVVYTSQALSDKIGDREKTVSKILGIGFVLQVGLAFFMCQMAYLFYFDNVSSKFELLLFVMRMILTELAPFFVFILSIQVEINRIEYEQSDDYIPPDLTNSEYTRRTSPPVSAKTEVQYRVNESQEDSELNSMT